MAKAINIDSYCPQEGEAIIFDTNIMIDLFYPMNVGKDTSAVAKLYQRILKEKAKIYVSSVQVSEFLNRCIRFQFDLYKTEHPECIDFKKDYRGNDDYNNCMQAILDIVTNEWKGKIQFVDDKFSELSVDNMFISNFAYDFNDAIIAEIANKYDAVFVTNDGDFISYKFNKPILSLNRVLLACR